jgi:translation initiation factor 3 subunit M
MASSAVYINNGERETDAVVQGAEWLATILGREVDESASQEFLAKFQEAYDNGDIAASMHLFLDNGDHLFASIPESNAGVRGDRDRLTEVESVFALVLFMLEQFDTPEDLEKSIDRLCTLFSNSVEQQPELRLRLLMQLYNTLIPVGSLRFRVFQKIISYAAEATLFDQVLPYLEYLDAWMEDWDMDSSGSGDFTLDAKRQMFLDLSGYMRALGKRVDAFLYLKRYAQLFQGADQPALKKPPVEQSTILLLKDALQLPSVIQFDDLLAFDTVKVLDKGSHAKLIDLVKLFLNGDVKDLDSFHKKNESVFKEYDINYQEAMSKMRLLTLATKVHGKSEISLSEVAKALEENEDNVERWVVRALSEGVIDGRIDQLNHKVLVKSAFQREFGKAEWAFLDSKLTQWTENLEHVIKFIGERKKFPEITSTAA